MNKNILIGTLVIVFLLGAYILIKPKYIPVEVTQNQPIQNTNNESASLANTDTACTSSDKPSLRIVSPNTGSFKGASTIPVVWKSCNLSTDSKIMILYHYENSTDGSVLGPVKGYLNTGSATIVLPYVGTYLGDERAGKIRLEIRDVTNKSISDSSDNTLTLSEGHPDGYISPSGGGQ